jgi:hypothetical protein
VTHGAGTVPEEAHRYLGHRVGHCGCSGYELVDPDGVLDAFLKELRCSS